MLKLEILPSAVSCEPTVQVPTKSNLQIALGLDKLAAQRKSVGENYSASAYETGAQIVRQYPSQITSGAQLASFAGIGQKIISQIDLILQGGVSPEVQANDKMLEAIKEFTSIYGIGEKIARQLWQQGYRSIDEVPDHNLTHAQQLGKRFRHDFSERIPRAEVAIIESKLQEWISPLNEIYRDQLEGPLVQITVAGSYRRLKDMCGDIDVLVMSRASDPQIVKEFILQCPANDEDMLPRAPFKRAGVELLVPYHLGQGSKKVLAVAKLPTPHCSLIKNKHRRIDFQFVTPSEYPLALLYFTGSGQHNKLMRGKALELGLTLNEYRLLDTSTGQELPAKTEADVFAHLGMQYKEPWDREVVSLNETFENNDMTTTDVLSQKDVTTYDYITEMDMVIAHSDSSDADADVNGASQLPMTEDINVMPFVATSDNVSCFSPL